MDVVLADMYDRTKDSIEFIAVQQNTGLGTGIASGSCWVWDKEGHLVTNNHVVEGASQVLVQFGDGLGARALEVRILAAIVNKIAERDLQQCLDEQNVGISALQHRVVRLLSHRTATITELSRMMGPSPATLVGVVDALERQGLVKRGYDPDDRRRTPLLLTESGREVLKRFPPIASGDSVMRGLSEMGEEAAQQLLELLRALVTAATQDEDRVKRVHAAVYAGTSPAPTGEGAHA